MVYCGLGLRQRIHLPNRVPQESEVNWVPSAPNRLTFEIWYLWQWYPTCCRTRSLAGTISLFSSISKTVSSPQESHLLTIGAWNANHVTYGLEVLLFPRICWTPYYPWEGFAWYDYCHPPCLLRDKYSSRGFRTHHYILIGELWKPRWNYCWWKTGWSCIQCRKLAHPLLGNYCLKRSVSSLSLEGQTSHILDFSTDEQWLRFPSRLHEKEAILCKFRFRSLDFRKPSPERPWQNGHGFYSDTRHQMSSSCTGLLENFVTCLRESDCIQARTLTDRRIRLADVGHALDRVWFAVSSPLSQCTCNVKKHYPAIATARCAFPLRGLLRVCLHTGG